MYDNLETDSVGTRSDTGAETDVADGCLSQISDVWLDYVPSTIIITVYLSFYDLKYLS